MALSEFHLVDADDAIVEHVQHDDGRQKDRAQRSTRLDRIHAQF